MALEDSHARRYLKEALSRAGYAAVLSGDSRIILERRKTAGHSFAILEGGAPVLDTLRTLRKQGNPIPVLLLSGAGPGLPTSGSPDVGTVGHLSAPFTLETLQLAIGNLYHSDSIGDFPLLGDR